MRFYIFVAKSGELKYIFFLSDQGFGLKVQNRGISLPVPSSLLKIVSYW